VSRGRPFRDFFAFWGRTPQVAAPGVFGVSEAPFPSVKLSSQEVPRVCDIIGRLRWCSPRWDFVRSGAHFAVPCFHWVHGTWLRVSNTGACRTPEEQGFCAATRSFGLLMSVPVSSPVDAGLRCLIFMLVHLCVCVCFESSPFCVVRGHVLSRVSRWPSSTWLSGRTRWTF